MTKEEAIKILFKYKEESKEDYYVKRAEALEIAISALEQQKTGRCKDCKFFEYDSVANVDGIPLIVAHEICSRWGDGCKTREDGFCFLFEPKIQKNEVNNDRV